MGECDKNTAEDMLDFFYENGGNFIDTFVYSLLSSFKTNSSQCQ
jgi:aryl-alcohol dehydrogenase-like predicted oxidoreductase